MVSRTQHTPFGDWWWTIDRATLAALIGLMLGGIILSLAASPPVAARLNLDAFHFVNRHILFLAPTVLVLLVDLVAVAAAGPPRWRWWCSW